MALTAKEVKAAKQAKYISADGWGKKCVGL